VNDNIKEHIISFGIGFSLILFIILIIWLATTFKLIGDILLMFFALFIFAFLSWLLGSMIKDILRMNGYELDTKYISEQTKWRTKYVYDKSIQMSRATRKLITKLIK